MPLRILIADDDPIHRTVLAKMVEKLGHFPTLVTSGEQAVEAIEARSADIVLMDIRMPGMGGIRAARCVSDSVSPQFRPRMIALTADHSATTRAACLKAGMDEYLTKPVDLVSLRRAFATDSSDRLSAEPDSNKPDSAEVTSANKTIDADVLEGFRTMLGANEPGFMENLEADFVQDAAALARAINRAAQNHDSVSVGRAAHTLKSNSMMFGASRLAALTRTMEILADEGLVKPWAPLHIEIMREIDRIRDKLVVNRPVAS
jgi:CheY-like chemotaxis protein